MQLPDIGAGWARRAADAALGLLLPPRCLVCGGVVEGAGAVCADCWPGITFLGAPHCNACGYPFEFDSGPDALCAACAAKRPSWGRARAVIAYDEASRSPVLAFKHGDRIDAAPAFGSWLARAGAALLEGADILVPVPLHRTRLLSRRYNQAALLALAAGREGGIAVAPDLLVRTRRTPSQGRLSASARRRNVAGAFALRSGRADRIDGRRVVLVDDVLTTGATAEACTRTLLGAGAANVDVLTLARVVRPAAVDS